MTLYKEILSWSQSKPLPMFMQDAIRRLLIKPELDNTDIEELVLLLKKETGFEGITNEALAATEQDIPSNASKEKDFAKLTKIKSPQNINALWEDAEVCFETKGLNLVYGKNGSGKSSYSRLLKKLCWSRHKNVELKKNIYTGDTKEQEVLLEYLHGGKINTFQWKENRDTIQPLNSIYVFDSNCASIYLNKENPTEYKPVGIDLLEKLIQVCEKISIKINSERDTLTEVKYPLDISRYGDTDTFKWFQSIESKPTDEIKSTLVFNPAQVARKDELIVALKKSNPIEENKNLQQKIVRYETVLRSLQEIENYFSEEEKAKLIEIKTDFFTKKKAYNTAQKLIKGNDPLEGVGSETWRQLWTSAKQYALTEVHPESTDFPSSKSEKTCVLCQQPLSPDSKDRLKRFNSFVKDKTNTEYLASKEILEVKIQELNDLGLTITDTYEELKNEIKEWDNLVTDFENILDELKKSFIKFINTYEENFFCIKRSFPSLQDILIKRIKELNKKIEENTETIQKRSILEKELLELEALEDLVKKKDEILKYYSEYKQKKSLDDCKSKVQTQVYSRKIGDIMESSAINLHHQEFIKHLTSLNPLIAEKVSITKTRTSNGETFHQCKLNKHQEKIPNIFSEGEQKIVALANFLSECTLDGATNTIIFDDPVNSLDQDYREAIAIKLVELSKTRQVIVLTHDLYFLRLLIDLNKDITKNESNIIGIESHEGISGITSDEIPYLAKNVQERIDTIRADLSQIKALDVSQISKIEPILAGTRKNMRLLLEKSVEDILINRTIQRFSKNIKLKKDNLLSLVVVESKDIEFILGLFGKYSVTEHDGSHETVPLQPNQETIKNHLKDFEDWRKAFLEKVKKSKENSNA